MALKEDVRTFWQTEACGERYGDFESQARARYELEPYIFEFARFQEGAGRDVLEIGVGMGADHVEWAKSDPRSLSGVDLTERAVGLTRERLALYGLESNVRVGDAENLPFADNSFDIVYSYGVLHHSPDTPGAVKEVFRVLRPGGTARIMIYHSPSLVGLMLWARYGAAAGKPFISMRAIYANYLESPGTKAYSVREARTMFHDFEQTHIKVQTGSGDLLLGKAGDRYDSVALRVARKLWPRWFIERFLGSMGLGMMIEARKPRADARP